MRCAIPHTDTVGVIGLYMRASFADNKADFVAATAVMHSLPFVANTAVSLLT